MSTSEAPLIDKDIILEKFSGKGGWTFARIPEIPQSKKNPFGWKKVKGFIDKVEIKQYHLMPMGNGQLFLPVKAAIRKELMKQEGDFVHVTLYEDNAPREIPEEFILCLKEDKNASENFFGLSQKEQKKIIDWIYAVKGDDMKIERMALIINKLAKESTV